MASGGGQFDDNGEAWEHLLASLCRFQSILPDAPVAGGTAAALYVGHRFSFDHDHVLPDLHARFDDILAQLEAVAGWETARRRRPVLILGSLDGVETGVRQLQRSRPLETTTMRVGEHDVTVPTLPEVLRIKAYLCVTRNATRDYVDLAALTSHMGIAAAAEALLNMDELYLQRNGDTWAVRTQLVMQLAAPPPHDLPGDDLSEYRGIRPPFNRWSHVAEVCGKLSDRLLAACVEALRADSSPAAKQAHNRHMARGPRRWRNAATREFTGACTMRHRHLIHHEFTAAAIEDILDRGRMPDWEPLIAAIEADPHGRVADTTLELCERERDQPLYGAAVFRRVIAAARQPSPGSRKSRVSHSSRAT